MKAVVYDRYGGPEVLRIEKLPVPQPGPGEVLVRVVAAGVATGDVHLLRGKPFMVRMVFGLGKPRIHVLGSDVAGRVEAVGEGVTRLRPGDEVFGSTAQVGFGTWAEFVCVPEAVLVPKPSSVGFVEAAAVPGSALAALQGLRDKGRVRAGMRVLVNGASGAVGSFGAQIAKAFGAEVTGVCSTANVELVRSLGADRVIDYTREDFRGEKERYDVVLDAAAYRPLWATLPAVARGGCYVFVGGGSAETMQALILGPIVSRISGKRAVFFISTAVPDDVAVLAEMLDEGKLRPVLDRRFPLEHAAEAVRYLEGGRHQGKVVLDVDPASGQ